MRITEGHMDVAFCPGFDWIYGGANYKSAEQFLLSGSNAGFVPKLHCSKDLQEMAQRVRGNIW